MWPSVRRGEESNIFPFQDSADVVFNSALIYEIAALKPYIEPLLFAVPKGCPEYWEAKRLLKFLSYFLPPALGHHPHHLPHAGVHRGRLLPGLTPRYPPFPARRPFRSGAPVCFSALFSCFRKPAPPHTQGGKNVVK